MLNKNSISKILLSSLMLSSFMSGNIPAYAYCPRPLVAENTQASVEKPDVELTTFVATLESLRKEFTASVTQITKKLNDLGIKKIVLDLKPGPDENHPFYTVNNDIRSNTHYIISRLLDVCDSEGIEIEYKSLFIDMRNLKVILSRGGNPICNKLILRAISSGKPLENLYLCKGIWMQDYRYLMNKYNLNHTIDNNTKVYLYKNESTFLQLNSINRQYQTPKVQEEKSRIDAFKFLSSNTEGIPKNPIVVFNKEDTDELMSAWLYKYIPLDFTSNIIQKLENQKVKKIILDFKPTRYSTASLISLTFLMDIIKECKNRNIDIEFNTLSIDVPTYENVSNKLYFTPVLFEKIIDLGIPLKKLCFINGVSTVSDLKELCNRYKLNKIINNNTELFLYKIDSVKSTSKKFACIDGIYKAV